MWFKVLSHMHNVCTTNPNLQACVVLVCMADNLDAHGDMTCRHGTAHHVLGRRQGPVAVTSSDEHAIALYDISVHDGQSYGDNTVDDVVNWLLSQQTGTAAALPATSRQHSSSSTTSTSSQDAVQAVQAIAAAACTALQVGMYATCCGCYNLLGCFGIVPCSFVTMLPCQESDATAPCHCRKHCLCCVSAEHPWQ